MVETPTDGRVAHRSRERRGAATIRALSGRPRAEWRGQRLSIDGRAVAVASPYLVAPAEGSTVVDGDARARGVADGLGLMLRHSDLELHARLSPPPVLEHVVFDALEQLRCDALAPAHLPGARANLRAAFDGWSHDAVAAGVAENRTAMLVFTVVHMVRSRLLRTPLTEELDELTEAARFHLAPVIGHALRRLPTLVTDQRAYAEAAAEIARLVAELADDAGSGGDHARAVRHRLVVPVDWAPTDAPTDADAGLAAPGGPAGSGPRGGTGPDLDRVGDYRVYTREFDREVSGRSLYPDGALRTLRGRLDDLERAQAISAPRLAARLLRLLGTPTDDDWSYGEDDGVLDGRRLSRLVATGRRDELFKRRHRRRSSDTVVAFLLDNSGSMKRQRYDAVAVLVDTFSRALDLAGVSNEVLGFTTGAWAGGRPIERWRRAGEPVEPGRMNEALHVVYKDADTGWRRSRLSLAALLRTDHYREGLDGEALAWAHRRLLARPEPNRILVLVSDGAPTDAATANVNRPGYLDDHLVGVADRIERYHAATGHGVQLGAIGIDLDMGRTVRRSVTADLSGTLTLQHYGTLAELVER